MSKSPTHSTFHSKTTTLSVVSDKVGASKTDVSRHRTTPTVAKPDKRKEKNAYARIGSHHNITKRLEKKPVKVHGTSKKFYHDSKKRSPIRSKQVSSLRKKSKTMQAKENSNVQKSLSKQSKTKTTLNHDKRKNQKVKKKNAEEKKVKKEKKTTKVKKTAKVHKKQTTSTKHRFSKHWSRNREKSQKDTKLSSKSHGANHVVKATPKNVIPKHHEPRKRKKKHSRKVKGGWKKHSASKRHPSLSKTKKNKNSNRKGKPFHRREHLHPSKKSSITSAIYSIHGTPVVPRNISSATSSCHVGNILYDHSLRYGRKAGNFVYGGEMTEMSDCLDFCCKDVHCSLALMIGKSCYAVECAGTFCQTVPVKHLQFNPKLAFVIRSKGKHYVNSIIFFQFSVFSF